MNSRRLGARRAAAVLAAALPLLACPQIAPAGDAEAGREKARLCVDCHGPGGNSVNPAMPSLAGQPQQFIATQLIMYRIGNRKNPDMSLLARNLNNADLNDLAAYFSAQPPAPPARGTTPDTAAVGRRLSEQHHCVACHGPALAGQRHIPRLAGQQSEYLRVQLRGFKTFTRFDMDGQMSSAAQLLADTEIEVLADYLSGLP